MSDLGSPAYRHFLAPLIYIGCLGDGNVHAAQSARPFLNVDKLPRMRNHVTGPDGLEELVFVSGVDNCPAQPSVWLRSSLSAEGDDE